jgi:hypothetical protein
LKVFKGDFIALKAIVLALIDLVVKMPKNIKHRNALTEQEYVTYSSMTPAKIYWIPK